MADKNCEVALCLVTLRPSLLLRDHVSPARQERPSDVMRTRPDFRFICT